MVIDEHHEQRDPEGESVVALISGFILGVSFASLVAYAMYGIEWGWL